MKSFWRLLGTIGICLLSILPLVSLAGPGDKPAKDPAKAEASTTKADAKPESKSDKPIREEKPRTKPNAKEKPTSAKEAANKPAEKPAEGSPEREQAALDFAAQQHPELAALIAPLKTSNPKEYQRAIRELYRTSERLAGIRLKDPARYDLELDAWKLQSQIRLLTARLIMASDPELEAQLKETLQKKTENQLKLYENERETLQSRLAQIQKQIDRASKSQDQLVQQEYDRLLKAAGRDRKVVPKANPGRPVTKNKPSSAKPSSTTSSTKE